MMVQRLFARALEYLSLSVRNVTPTESSVRAARSHVWSGRPGSTARSRTQPSYMQCTVTQSPRPDTYQQVPYGTKRADSRRM